MYKLTRYKGLSGPAFFCLLSLGSSAAAAQTMLLPVTELSIGTSKIQAEIAATDASRALGLMHRQSLLKNHGMLFVFDQAAGHCFWMKNTPLPLSIAFITDNGVVLNIADMQPHSLDSHCPTAAARYALEMEQGWFHRHQIQTGQSVSGLPKP